jgi:hypothetical protein
LKGALFFLGLLFLFRLLISIAAIIHYLTNGWICVRRNFYEVKANIGGCRKSFFGRYDTDLISFRVDYSYFSGSYSLININFIRSIRSLGSSWNSYACTSYARVISRDYSGVKYP